MRDAPAAAARRAACRSGEIVRRGHGRVGDRPDQRGSRHIGAHQHDAVGQRHDCQALSGRSGSRRRSTDAGSARPAARPARESAQISSAGDHGGGRAQRRRRLRCVCGESRRSTKWRSALAASRVGRLDRERVERPEAALRRAATAAGRRTSQARRAATSRIADQTPASDVRNLVGPVAARSWRRSARRRASGPGTTISSTQAAISFGQADLGQQAAGERQQRALLGAGRVVLDVAAARIDAGPQVAHPQTRTILPFAGGKLHDDIQR